MDKVIECGQCFVASGGEPPGAVDTGELDALALPSIEIVAHLSIDVVLGRPHRIGKAQGRGTPWRWKAVVGIEVPAAPFGLVARHEDSCTTPGIAVEVLLAELSTTTRPPLEVCLGRDEAAGGQDRDTGLADELPRCEGSRIDHAEWLAC